MSQRRSASDEIRARACLDCGGKLRPAGEDVAEMLEWVPGRHKVLRHVRPKFSCGKCQKLIQVAAGDRAARPGSPGQPHRGVAAVERRRPDARVAVGRLILVASMPTLKRSSIRGSVTALRVGSILLGAFIAAYLAIVTYTVSNRRLLIFTWCIGLLALGLLYRAWRRSSARTPKEPSR